MHYWFCLFSNFHHEMSHTHNIFLHKNQAAASHCPIIVVRFSRCLSLFFKTKQKNDGCAENVKILSLNVPFVVLD